jgi:hypothetical protein
MTLKKLSESSSTFQTLHKMSVNIFHLNRCDLVGIINYNSFHLNMFNLFSNKFLRINPYTSCFEIEGMYLDVIGRNLLKKLYYERNIILAQSNDL